MKRDADHPTNPSRRTFTQSIAAALLMAQFACNRSSSPCTCPEPNPGDPVKCPNVIPGLETEPHQPPIIVTNGSFRLDMNKTLHFPPDNITGNPVRHFRFSLDEQSYGNIHRVQVITERPGFMENFFYYPNRLCHLRIWLQKRMGHGWDPPTTSGEPHILFSFALTSGVPLFSLETDSMLRERVDSFKPSREHRYEHPGFGGGPHFRLAKWSLTDPASGNVISPGFEGDLTLPSPDPINGFQLAVSFEDFPRLLLRQKK